MPTVRYTTLDSEVIAEKRNGVRKLYVPDPLGSTVAMLDGTQAQTDTFAYWPYGEARSRTGTTPTPFQFVGNQGYYRDSPSKTYVRARTLDTAKGRWLTVDPAGFQGGSWNLYSYVNDRPSVLTDPTGLSFCCTLHLKFCCKPDPPAPPAPSPRCDTFKATAIAVNCQDCCDEKLLDELRKRMRGGFKEIAKCLAGCISGDAEERANCATECVKAGGPKNLTLIVGTRNYLLCCYGICNVCPTGFTPPGGCEKCLSGKTKDCIAAAGKWGIKNIGDPNG